MRLSFVFYKYVLSIDAIKAHHVVRVQSSLIPVQVSSVEILSTCHAIIPFPQMSPKQSSRYVQ